MLQRQHEAELRRKAEELQKQVWIFLETEDDDIREGFRNYSLFNFIIRRKNSFVY